MDSKEKDAEIEKENHFEISNVVKWHELELGSRKKIPESDLCLTFPQGIAQFKLIEKKEEKQEIKPGVSALIDQNGSATLKDVDLKFDKLLDSVDNTQRIIEEAGLFFSKLHVYDELQIQKKRAILLYGPPGTGKSSSIGRVIKKLNDEDSTTSTIIWNTSQVYPDSVYNFLNFRAEFHKDCKRFILVIEDIGGVGSDSEGNKERVEAGLLNLLDGVDMTFKIPTFIIATTNHPHTLLESLADRPGRFDKLISLGYPSPTERVALAEFFLKADLGDQKSLFSGKSTETFSVAHIKEVILRSKISGKSIESVIIDIQKHKDLIKKDFIKPKKMGFEM